MKKITQKEFKKILENRQNYLLASQFLPNCDYDKYIQFI